MDLITQQWISCSVWRSTIGWGKWLHNDRIPDRKKILGNMTYLGWYIVVKVPAVLRIVEFGTR
jgi:hypothetical protein